MKQPFHFLLEDDVVLSVYVYVFVRTYMQALKFYQLVFVRLLSVRMKFVRMFVRYCMRSREQLVDQLRLLKFADSYTGDKIFHSYTT